MNYAEDRLIILVTMLVVLLFVIYSTLAGKYHSALVYCSVVALSLVFAISWELSAMYHKRKDGK